ncbi:hypothetical protein KHQ81_15740 (plasmid) [Mycoplasmatota bacterium]|nr:hypothetical protein KHQ81_15740 [Mycoplasmatota bacterium]
MENHNEQEVYRYYLKLRPPGIGTQPKGTNKIVSYDKKENVWELNISAWGYVEYDRLLTEKEINDYELYFDKRYGKPLKMPNNEWDHLDYLDKLSYIVDYEKKEILNYIKDYEGYTFKLPKYDEDGYLYQWLIVHPYTKKEDYKCQLTYFDKEMKPIGDSAVNTIDEVSNKLYEYGYKNTIFKLIEANRPPLLARDFKQKQLNYKHINHPIKNKNNEVELT